MGFFTRAARVLVPVLILGLSGCTPFEDLFSSATQEPELKAPDEPNEDTPLPPGVIKFTLPSDGASITSPMLLKVAGSSISSVRFLVDGTEVLKDTNDPYEWTLYPNVVGEGDHSLAVEVTHSGGVTLKERDVQVKQTAKGAPAPEEVLATIDSLPGGHWYGIPNSEMRGVTPDPAPPGNTGVKAITGAWGGGAYDTKRDRLIVWGGGHQDYSGNEIYAFELNKARWLRLNDPSPFAEGDGNNPDNDVTHPDGSPISRHTYGYIEYLPGPDRFYCGGGAGIWKSGQFGDTNTYLFDFDALSWSKKSKTPVSGASAACAVDADGRVWQLNTGPSFIFAHYDPETDKWTSHGTAEGFPRWYYYAAAIDTKRDRMIFTGRGGIWTVNLKKPNAGFTERTGAGATAIQDRAAFGMVYHADSDRMVAWSGGSDVYTLNPETFVWTKHATTGAETPGEASKAGTYGRFRYVPSKDIFILVNSIDRNVFVYRLP